MKNKLFIRFFRNKEDVIPVDSWEVCSRGELDMYHFQHADVDKATVEWMNLYHNGKIDFVWL